MAIFSPFYGSPNTLVIPGLSHVGLCLRHVLGEGENRALQGPARRFIAGKGLNLSASLWAFMMFKGANGALSWAVKMAENQESRCHPVPISSTKVVFSGAFYCWCARIADSSNPIDARGVADGSFAGSTGDIAQFEFGLLLGACWQLLARRSSSPSEPHGRWQLHLVRLLLLTRNRLSLLIGACVWVTAYMASSSVLVPLWFSGWLLPQDHRPWADLFGWVLPAAVQRAG